MALRKVYTYTSHKVIKFKAARVCADYTPGLTPMADCASWLPMDVRTAFLAMHPLANRYKTYTLAPGMLNRGYISVSTGLVTFVLPDDLACKPAWTSHLASVFIEQCLNVTANDIRSSAGRIAKNRMYFHALKTP